MDDLSHATDVSDRQALWEQVAALHGIQHAHMNSQAAEKLGELVKLVESILSL